MKRKKSKHFLDIWFSRTFAATVAPCWMILAVTFSIRQFRQKFQCRIPIKIEVERTHKHTLTHARIGSSNNKGRIKQAHLKAIISKQWSKRINGNANSFKIVLESSNWKLKSIYKKKDDSLRTATLALIRSRSYTRSSRSRKHTSISINFMIATKQLLNKYMISFFLCYWCWCCCCCFLTYTYSYTDSSFFWFSPPAILFSSFNRNSVSIASIHSY